MPQGQDVGLWNAGQVKAQGVAFTVTEVDITKHPDVVQQQYGIRATPALAIDGRLAFRGVPSKRQLFAHLRKQGLVPVETSVPQATSRGFLVTLMQVRERSREIGTLEAIGASDGAVTVEVLTEAIAFTILGGLVALLSFTILGEAITGPVFSFGITPFLPSHYQPLVHSLSINNQISVSGLGVLVAGAVLALAIGSAYGLWQVCQLSPLEAMKHG